MNKQLLDYFKGDELAANVWQSKYAAEGEETPDDMHKRMSKEFARIEGEYLKKDALVLGTGDNYNALSKYGTERKDLTEESIFELFKDFKYIIPQGSIMATLGTNQIASLSNCLGGDTKVLTRYGFKAISSLVDTEQEILTLGGEWVKAPFKSFGEQDTITLKLTRGKSDIKYVTCTKNHDWFLSSSNRNPKKIKASELKVGDKLHSQFSKGYRNIKPSFFGVAHGLVFGDGYSPKNENYYSSITLYNESREFSRYFPDSYISSNEELCQGGSDYYGRLPNSFKKKVDLSENKSYLLGWLAGYFAADGNIHKNSLRISSTDKSNLELVQDVCGILGIHCGEIKSQNRISNLTNKESEIFTVHFSSYFLNEDFFIRKSHKEEVRLNSKKPSSWVVSEIVDSGVKEVFCGMVEGTHSFTIEGNILSGNCWVIESPVDSYAGIHKADGDLIYYYKRRGGVGVDISNLRPANTVTNNAAKSTTGAVSFMHRFSNTTREVAMNGRRGALMISIDINHPDVMDFIKIKRDGTSVTGANISIRLNNEFMKAVENDEDYILRFPCDIDIVDGSTEDIEYNKLYKNPTGNSYYKKIKAKEYWDEIVKSARNHAEPGLMYWDNALNYDPAAVYPQYLPESTNPCGEQFLQPNDSCRLMVHNLGSYVKNPFTKDASFDFELFYKNAYECGRLGDDLVDLEAEYIQRIIDKIKEDPESDDVKRHELELWIKSKRICQEGRRVGIGITALGDTLASLNLKYDSDEGLAMIDKIMKVKMEAELDATIDLSILRGSFHGWDHKLEDNAFYGFVMREYPEQYERMNKYGRRNISWSTIAPTGSVSLLAGNCTSGCEPLFQPFYIRRKKINPGEAGVRVDFVDEVGDSWQEFAVLHPKFKEWLESKINGNIDPHEREEIDVLSKEVLQEWFEKSPWFGSTANDIDWKKRVEIQAILQSYTTNAINTCGFTQ